MWDINGNSNDGQRGIRIYFELHGNKFLFALFNVD